MFIATDAKFKRFNEILNGPINFNYSEWYTGWPYSTQIEFIHAIDKMATHRWTCGDHNERRPSAENEKKLMFYWPKSQIRIQIGEKRNVRCSKAIEEDTKHATETKWEIKPVWWWAIVMKDANLTQTFIRSYFDSIFISNFSFFISFCRRQSTRVT